MRTAAALFVLAMLAFAANAQRQDEALDSLMLSTNLQPVNDPIPRLLAEALESGSTPGSYGKPPAIPTTMAPVTTPPAQKSASSSAAAGAFSLMAAVAAAAVLL